MRATQMSKGSGGGKGEQDKGGTSSLPQSHTKIGVGEVTEETGTLGSSKGAGWKPS